MRNQTRPGKLNPVDALPRLDTTAATTELLSEIAGIDQIPFSALCRIGAIFAEGEHKYGRDNWRILGDDRERIAYTRERYRHALRHLMTWFLEYEGIRKPTGEDHLAKVGWFVATTMEREELEALKENK